MHCLHLILRQVGLRSVVIEAFLLPFISARSFYATHFSYSVLFAGPGAVSEVVQTIKNRRDLSIDFTVARSSGVQHVEVLPDIGADGKGKIGVQLAGNVDIVRQKVEGAVELVTRSGAEVSRLLVATVEGLKGLIGNFDAAKESVSSPVAVVAVGSQVARESPSGAHCHAGVGSILGSVQVARVPCAGQHGSSCLVSANRFSMCVNKHDHRANLHWNALTCSIGISLGSISLSCPVVQSREGSPD